MGWLSNIFRSTPIKLDLSGPRDLKLAYDLQRVGLRGRPQHPDTDISSLFSWRRRNELVYACIEKIAQAALDPEVVVERLNPKGEWEEEPEHPLRRLLKRPNPLDDEGSFLGAWLSSEHIAGGFYAEIVRSPAGLPAQLWPLDPSKTSPVAGKGENNNPIVAFEYREGGQRVQLKERDVLHRTCPDLTNRFHGLSPLAVALGAVDSDTAQTDYVRAFFNNDGTPSGLLKTDQRLDEASAAAMEQRWTGKFSRYGLKRKGVAVLGQGLTYERTGAQLDELEADSLRGQSEARICMVFGVPPLLVGAYVGLLHVNQRASAREAQSDFWVNKMSPLFKRLRSFLTWRLLPEFEGIELVAAGRVRVSWDMSQVIALQEDTDARHTRARENVGAGIWTVNEGREETGQEPDNDGDYYIRPFTVSAIDPAEALRVQKVPAGKEPKSAKGVKVFDFEGLRLTREPNAVEALAVKAVARAQELGRNSIKETLLTCRSRLIREAVDALSKMKVGDYPALTLEVSEGERTRLKGALSRLADEGRRQVADELNEQNGKNFILKLASKQVTDGDEFDDLTDATLSRVVNDVQSRAVGAAVSLVTLGVAAADFRARLKGQLDGLSEAPQEQAAAMAANRALAMGRADEMEAREGEIERFQWSSILDANLCEECAPLDGKEAESLDDLPDAPYEFCLGMALCRCFILSIAK